jgi:drug/metabolite transporter (DMT)-like permease
MTRETWGLLLGLLGVVMFAGTLPATRLAVVALDPWFVTMGRAALAGLLALTVLLVLRRPWPGSSSLRPMLLGTFCLVIGFPGFIGLAMKTVPAAHGGVVLGLMPLATAAFAALVLGERPSGRFWFFAALGALIVVGFSLRDGGGRLEIGDLYLLLAGALSSLGYVLSGRLARTMPGWEVISWMLVMALPFTLPMAWWLQPALPETVPFKAWAGFAYVTLFSQFLGFFAWNAGLAMGGVARVSQTQLMQTFVTLGIAAVVNDEVLDPVTVFAAIAVVAVVMFGRKAQVVR